MQRILPRLTATPLQATAYLGGIALFSISFLVFLNATISFVITDVIGQRSQVGNAVGTLGFADELVALVACPLWGLLSDRVGVRWVAVAGYVVIGFSLVCLVQSGSVYPDLILWRMVFSVGAAACTTMVTAVLPAMTATRNEQGEHGQQGQEAGASGAAATNGAGPVQTRSRSGENVNRHSLVPSVSSELTITPVRYQSNSKSSSRSPLLARYRHRRRSMPNINAEETKVDPDMDTSRIAGFVGMFTGIGALIALVIFLPLPVTLGKGVSKAQAVQNSFYIVGAASLLVGVFVGFGLRHLPGEEGKGFRLLFGYSVANSSKDGPPEAGTQTSSRPAPSYITLFTSALKLAFTDSRIALGYIGGFVARASSVGVSTFIPLFVNAYYIREGICDDRPGEALKSGCERAYKTASMLTGISQLVALLAAPLYGYFNARYVKKRYMSRFPLALAAICGIVGNLVFGMVKTPDVKKGGSGALLAVMLIGLGQIGAIVCSLGILAQGIQNATLRSPAPEPSSTSHANGQQNGLARSDVPDAARDESAPLLAEPQGGLNVDANDRGHLKGSIAGVYSLAGGAAILLLTKLGGHLFDVASVGAPFFLLAGFNTILLVAVLLISCGSAISHVQASDDSQQADHTG